MARGKRRARRVADVTEGPSQAPGAITALLESPAEIVDIFVEALCALVDAGGSGDCNSLYRRNLLVSFLNNLPILNRTLCSLAQADGRYASVMYYERTRLGAGASGHFLEALPRGLSLFGFNADECMEMNLQASLIRISKERTALIEKLEARKHAAPDMAGGDNCLDLSAGVPWRAQHFVAAQRSYVARMRGTKPAHFFCQCPHRACQRMVYCGPIRQMPDHGDDAPGYWSVLDKKSNSLDVHAAKFCSWFCRQSHSKDVTVLKESLQFGSLDADTDCRKEGRLRVAEALRKCARRNESIGRALRELESTLHTPSIDPRPFLVTMKRRLNIDLGLLYAASILAESRSLSEGKVLAGAHDAWRGRPVFYMHAIRTVGEIYDKHHKGGNVVSNLHIDEPFLRKLKAVCLRIF